MLGIVDLSSLSARSMEWVTVLVDASIKGMAVLLLAVLLRIALRRATASARYLIWCLALGSVVALPLVSAIYPVWNLPILPRVEPGERAPGVTRNLAPLLPGGAEPEPLSPPIGSIAVPDAVPNSGTTTEVPSYSVKPVTAPAASAADASANVKPAERSASPHWSLFLLMAWAVGALVILTRYLIGTVRVARLVRRAEGISENNGPAAVRKVAIELGLAARIRLLLGDGMNVPMTWGCLRPLVLLPAEAERWSEERLRIVLLHERAHVQRRDCLTQMLSQIASAIYWFNPLAWLAARELRIERERACDDRVLSGGSKPSEYASHLLEIVRSLHAKRCLSFAAVPMAHLSKIERRLRAILDRNRNRRGLTRLAILMALLAVAGIVLPLGMTRLTATAQNKPQAEKPDSKRTASPVGEATAAPYLEAKLEFDKEIPLGLKAGKRLVGDRDHWTVELLWAKFSRATVFSILGDKDQIQATVRVKTSSVLEAKWRVSVELLDDEDKSLARAEHVFETMFSVQYDHVQTALGQLDFSLGPLEKLAKLAKFRVAMEQAPDNANVTIDPIAAAGHVVWAGSSPQEVSPATELASFKGQLEFDKKIPLPAELRAGKRLVGEREYFAITADWVQFFRIGEEVGATLHVKTASVQSARWRLGLRLLNEEANVVGEDQAVIGTTLVIERYPSGEVGCLSFSLGRWSDVSRATKFGLSIEQAENDTKVTAHLSPEGPVAWGEEVNGLRAGISLELGERAYHVGETVSFVFRVANVSSDPIHLSDTSLPLLGWTPIVTDRNGRRMAVNNLSPIYNILTQPAERSLAPGETVILGSFDLSIRPPGWKGETKGTTLLASPGKYRISQPYRFQASKPNDWSGELQSGWLDLDIVAAEPQPVVIRGLDLSTAPCTTRFGELRDLFEARPPGSRSYHLRDDIVRAKIPPATGASSFPIGEVFHLPDKNVFYVQHDAAGASTLHYYGPFEGDPFEGMNLPRPRSQSGVSVVPAPSPEVARVEGTLEFDTDIPVGLVVGTKEEPDLLRFAWIRFSLAQDQLDADLRFVELTKAAAKWCLQVQLLDNKDRVLSEAEGVYATRRLFRGAAVRSEGEFHFELGDRANARDAVRFAVSVAQAPGDATVTLERKSVPLPPTKPEKGEYSLEISVVGADGQPPERFSLIVWRPIDLAEMPTERSAFQEELYWHDEVTGKVWTRCRSIAARTTATAENLPPGDYRVTACSGWGDDPTPVGVSPIIRLDGSKQKGSVSIQLKGDSALLVKVMDPASGRPVSGEFVLLRREDGMPVAHTGNWCRRYLDTSGTVRYGHLEPGVYWLEVGKSGWWFGIYHPESSLVRTRLEVVEGKENAVEVRTHPAPPEKAEAGPPEKDEGTMRLVPAPRPEIARVQGPLEFDKVISLPAEMRGGERVIGDRKVFAVEGQSVAFTKSFGHVRARLKVKTTTVFEAGWRATVALLDAEGHVLGQGYARFTTIYVVKGVPKSEYKILHFLLSRREDVSAAVKFRVSLAYDLRNVVPTAFDSFVDPLAFDREIPLVLMAGERMIGERDWYAVQGEWMKFTRKPGRIEASLHVTTTSVLDARWRATLELMTADGRIVASSQADFATILAIRGRPAIGSELLHFSLGNWEDVSSARSFRVRVERVTDAKETTPGAKAETGASGPSVEATDPRTAPEEETTSAAAEVREKVELRVRVVDSGGRPADLAAVTLWRPQGPGESLDDTWGNWQERILWREERSGRTWVPMAHHQVRNATVFKELTAGQYRVSAATADRDRRSGSGPSPVGASEVIQLDGRRKTAIVTVELQGIVPLTLKFLDANTRELLERVHLVLFRSDGVPVGYGSGNFHEFSKEDGSFHFGKLTPGTYRLKAGRRAFRFGQTEYKTAEDRMHVEVAEGRDNVVEVPMQPVELTEAEARKRWPLVVTGTVTDGEGHPMSGVKVWVSCGRRSLLPTGKASSSPDGKYTLRFGPGYGSVDKESGEWVFPWQFAVVGAQKPGYYEKNLSQQGSLSIAADPQSVPEGRRAPVIFPNQPYRLDFVMLPAVTIKGRMVDLEGQPVAGQRFVVDGDELLPAASILRNVTTDKQGRFTVSEVPCKTYWFALVAGRSREIKTDSVEFSQPGTYEIELTYDADKPSLELKSNHSLEIRVVDSKGQPAGLVMIQLWRPREPEAGPSPNGDDWGKPILWHDKPSGRTWVPDGLHQVRDSTVFEQLLPGEYRVSVARVGEGRGADPSPVGVSDFIRLSPDDKTVEITIRLEGETPLTLKFFDATDRKPLENAHFVLLRSDGFPVGHGRVFSGEDGTFRFGGLTPGAYWLKAGKRAWLHGQTEYGTAHDRIHIEAVEGRSYIVAVPLQPVELTLAEIEERWPFVVTGTVTDEGGQPVPGAEVRANCGMGTLWQTGKAISGPDGKYMLRFGPGMTSLDEESGKWVISWQFATVRAYKSGYCEKNLSRHGGLSIAGDAQLVPENPREPFILPNQPYQLDFVMLPAATVKGRLVGEDGRPIAGKRIYVNGDELPPSCSDLTAVDTDENGRFIVGEVPLRFWWLSVRDEKRGELKTDSITISTPGVYEIELSYKTGDGERSLKLKLLAAPGAS